MARISTHLCPDCGEVLIQINGWSYYCEDCDCKWSTVDISIGENMKIPMKIHKAKFVNTDPEYSGFPPVERSFADRGNAENWLLSFGFGKDREHYIDDENVTEAIRARRLRYQYTKDSTMKGQPVQLHRDLTYKRLGR